MEKDKKMYQNTKAVDMEWIDIEKSLPEDDHYILVSFQNFDLPEVARYEEDEEGGAFYPGDDDKSYAQYGLFVNAWMPLPKLYRPDMDLGTEELKEYQSIGTVEECKAAVMNFAVAVLAEVSECAKQEDAPVYEGNKEVDLWVRLSDVNDAINKHLN